MIFKNVTLFLAHIMPEESHNRKVKIAYDEIEIFFSTRTVITIIASYSVMHIKEALKFLILIFRFFIK
jgi:hypothetical protein